jgi:hypothetical protein
LGYFRVRSPLLSESLLFSFPSGTEMVHFPEFARTDLCIQSAVIRVHRIGFPHSEIPGSKPVSGSPRLIAASHVLHRLLLPRHPPCALSSLTIKFTQRIRTPVVRLRLRNSYGLISLTHRAAIAAPQSVSKALIKLTYFYITQPCRLPNLFSCQTSSMPRLGGVEHFCSKFNIDLSRRSILSRFWWS